MSEEREVLRSNGAQDQDDELKVKPEMGSAAEVQNESAEQVAEAGSQPEGEEMPEPAAELEYLKQKLSEAEARAAEYLDGWQRTQAEFINFRKRLERDRQVEYLGMKAEIIKKFLPVLDDLERALQNPPQENDLQAWVQGVELIVRKMQAILTAEGVERIEAEGQMFDPNLHEAVSHEPVDGKESGVVIGVVQQGYRLGERVIRPALVRVAQ
ncbi:MAG: nucleotide exchange factor GrpE [Anaerolineales bacterium]